MEKKIIDDYTKRLINKIFKLLPMKEENNPTLPIYMNSLLLELTSGQELLHGMFLDVVFNVYALKDLEDMSLYRSQVFKCISLCEKILKDNDAL